MQGTVLGVSDGPKGEEVSVQLQPEAGEAFPSTVYLDVNDDDADLLLLPVKGEVRGFELDLASGEVRFDKSDPRNGMGA